MKSRAGNITRRGFLLSALAPIVAGAVQYDADRVRRWLEAIYSTDPPASSPYTPDPLSWDPQMITVSWIGHSTVLLNFFGTVILTDPVFSDRVGLNMAGLFTLGPKRLVAPALSIEELPPIDLILISHGHMDHCDTATLKRLPKTIPVVMPAGTSSILDGMNFGHVTELDWGSMTNVAGVQLEAFPVEHRGSRFPWSGSASTGSEGGPGSNAYVISRNNTNIVFAGDTAFQDRFRDLDRRGTAIELAILPIGGYIPHHDNHCTPEEALMMADQMKANHILPIHWGTFPGEEGLLEPIERLRKAIADPGRIVIQDVGQTWTWNPYK